MAERRPAESHGFSSAPSPDYCHVWLARVYSYWPLYSPAACFTLRNRLVGPVASTHLATTEYYGCNVERKDSMSRSGYVNVKEVLVAW